MKWKIVGLVASLLMSLSMVALAAPATKPARATLGQAAMCRYLPAHVATMHPLCQGTATPSPTPDHPTTTAAPAVTTTTRPTTTTTAPAVTTTTRPTTTTTAPQAPVTTTTQPPAPTTTTTQPPAATTTTTQPPATTTTTSPAPDFSYETIWTGNRISDWYSVANSGGGDQDDVSINGGAAVDQHLPTIDGSANHGARLNFQGFDDPTSANPQAHSGARILPTEAVYSVTMFVPEYAGAQNNVFQFKQGNGTTRQHLWNFGWVPENGQLRGIIRSRLSGSEWGSLSDPLARLDWYVPIGESFTVEVFRRISTGSDGRYEVRIDGQLLYTFNGPTAASNLEPRSSGNHEWVLSHYLGEGYNMDGDVGPSSVYFSNASISR